jgi:hypothetical protein
VDCLICAEQKPHKNEENRRFLSAVFNIMRNLHLKISASFFFFYYGGFCSALNEAAPFQLIILIYL